MGSKGAVAICIVVENETVPFDRRVWLEARALADAGFKVSVICPKGGPYKKRRETLEGIDIYRYRALTATSRLGLVCEYLWSLLAQFLLTMRVYAHTRFRILHACSPPDIFFSIAVFYKLLGVRFVFDHHDLSPELYAARFGEGGPLYRLVCLAERFSFKTADLSIATNETFREIAMVRGRMRPDRVVMVQSCARLEELAETPPSDALRGNFPFMVAYVGQMEPQDGLELLLHSIRLIVEEQGRHDILFTLIGKGSELTRLRSSTAEWDRFGQVHFAGRVHHTEVCRYLTAADVCVAPDPVNAFNETCSMVKIFEYMAFGRPTVLYDLREGRRSAGGSALYAIPNDTVDFAKQILRLIDSKSLRTEMGVCGWRRVQDGLNWEAQSKKLVDAYQRLAGRRSAEVVVPFRRRIIEEEPRTLVGSASRQGNSES
jgi:glycosyltransferase involved in cell wall biosynthesis